MEISDTEMELKTQIEELDYDSDEGLEVKITKYGRSLFIGVENHGDYSSKDGEGTVVKLELYQGKLQVIVWKDINEQDPIIIDLEKAREDNRKENNEDFHYKGENKDIFAQK